MTEVLPQANTLSLQMFFSIAEQPATEGGGRCGKQKMRSSMSPHLNPPNTIALVANWRALVRMTGVKQSTSRQDRLTDQVIACQAYRGASCAARSKSSGRSWDAPRGEDPQVRVGLDIACPPPNPLAMFWLILVLALRLR